MEHYGELVLYKLACMIECITKFSFPSVIAWIVIALTVVLDIAILIGYSGGTEFDCGSGLFWILSSIVTCGISTIFFFALLLLFGRKFKAILIRSNQFLGFVFPILVSILISVVLKKTSTLIEADILIYALFGGIIVAIILYLFTVHKKGTLLFEVLDGNKSNYKEIIVNIICNRVTSTDEYRLINKSRLSLFYLVQEKKYGDMVERQYKNVDGEIIVVETHYFRNKAFYTAISSVIALTVMFTPCFVGYINILLGFLV